MFLFCNHKYEIKERIESCDNITFVSQCKKCGNLTKLETCCDKHKWTFVNTENIIDHFGNTTGRLNIFLCQKCKKMKQERINARYK